MAIRFLSMKLLIRLLSCIHIPSNSGVDSNKLCTAILGYILTYSFDNG